MNEFGPSPWHLHRVTDIGLQPKRKREGNKIAVLKVLTIIGARPQFIKAASVSRTIAQTDGVQEVLVHTGQHFDANMSEIFFDQLQIPKPAYALGIHGGGHGEMTGRMMIEIEKLIFEEGPDGVLVYGDTNSTLAGALAAAKLNIPVIHVEAGLRSFNRRMPEEVNRVLTDRVSSLLFTPTQLATENLRHEGIEAERVVQVGDVMYDAMLLFREFMPSIDDVTRSHDLPVVQEYVLTTIHRQENTDDAVRLEAILLGLGEIAKSTQVILPLHPRTRQRIADFGLSALLSPISTTEPLGFLEMMRLQVSAQVIVTDSGGVQKEAFFHGKPCVTLRDETEWIELVDAGWNKIAPPLQTDIAATVLSVIGSRGADIAPYGTGDAAKRIVEESMSRLCTNADRT